MATATTRTNGHSQNGTTSAPQEATTSDRVMLELRMYVLLMAILAATVTYVAGLNPPGGFWQLGTQDGYLAGNQILVVTDHTRYNAFFYSNATAFMASVVVIIILLLVERNVEKSTSWLVTLRVVMVLDLHALMVAYAAGASRGMVTTIFASVLVSAVFIYSTFHIINHIRDDDKESGGASANRSLEQRLKLERRRKILMLFAIFAATVTYTAGLSPPGGFWMDTQGGHRAGNPVLQDGHSRRFMAFFICNTAAFIASLVAVMRLTTIRSELGEGTRVVDGWLHVPYAFVLVALLGLFVAYAVGSCRKTRSTVYVGFLVVPVVVFTAILFLVHKYWLASGTDQLTITTEGDGNQGETRLSVEDKIGRRRAHYLVLLLATLAATITYQAGMNPPGGFWPDDRDGHRGGDPVLVTTHPKRYRVFFYCNSVALVASVVVIVMVQSKHLDSSVVHRSHALEAVMILDLLSLMAAYAVGCCRDVSTSLHVIALAGAVLVYVVIHVVLFTLDRESSSRDGGEQGRKEETTITKRRKLLLLLAILAATITYQSGLTPPGGFWADDNDHTAGYPVLQTNYPRRYTAFFYCNATSFMSSIAVIILLVNPNLYRLGIKCYALYVCAVAGLFGLMGAYAAGSARHLRTSILVFALVAAVLAFIFVLLLAFKPLSKREKAPARLEGGDPEAKKRYTKCKYLMLVGILVASVTYQAGLTPPGGVWPDGSDGHHAGDPVLHDSNRDRYRMFFYSNSVSFLASIVVILLLLLDELLFAREQGLLEMWSKQLPFVAQSSIVLALLGLMCAYASGCSREWETSGYLVALAVAVLLYMAIHVVLSCRDKKRGGGGAQGRTTMEAGHGGIAESSERSTTPQAQEDGHGGSDFGGTQAGDSEV